MKDNEKLTLQSHDWVADNQHAFTEFVKAKFPNCITEGRVDFDLLRQEVSSEIVEGPKERYRLEWAGKREAIVAANKPTNATLRPIRSENGKEVSVNFDTTENIYIEGDNLEVLKLLQESYLGKISMIYIDPPYNTGNEFIYPDDFSMSKKEWLVESGQIDENGNIVVADKNSQEKPRYHSNWVSMMYPRLKAAQYLLTDEGVIFISIDDHEVTNLRKMCDEIYGEENFVTQLVWEQGRKSMAAQIAVNHEYCLVYCMKRSSNIEMVSKSEYPYWMIPKEGLDAIYEKYEELKTLYSDNYGLIEKGMKDFYKKLPADNPSKAHAHYCRVDSTGLYFPGDIAQGTGNGGRFEILHPVTKKPCKVPAGGWRFSEKKLPELLHNDRIHFGKDETIVPCLKRYLRETEYEVMPSVFYKDGRGASKRLEALLGAKSVFPFPKDENILQSFIASVTPNTKIKVKGIERDPIILDFFSGSATTAHAVMQLNAEDGGNRKFIMVQLPEKTDETKEAYKAGYKNICEIGEERIRRAAKKIQEENPEGAKGKDMGFRVFRLDSSNMKEVKVSPDDLTQTELDWEAANNVIDNIKEGRTGEDLLFQVMLAWGLPLSLPVAENEIEGKKIYRVEADGVLILLCCFEKGVDEAFAEAVARQMPMRVLFRDSSFCDDNAKENVRQLLKQLSPNTEMRVL